MFGAILRGKKRHLAKTQVAHFRIVMQADLGAKDEKAKHADL